MRWFTDLDEMSDKASSEHGEEGEPGEQGSTKASSPGSSSSMPLPSMLLERRMETLVTEWNKSPDMLFTIHPADGSFLVWHVKYLDEFNQGIFRQVQVGPTSPAYPIYLILNPTVLGDPCTGGWGRCPSGPSAVDLTCNNSVTMRLPPGVLLVPYPSGVSHRRRQLSE